MVNKVILVGNVGQDPEVKYIQPETPVAQFSLATSESYTSKTGEKVTNTEWHNIVAWRGLAKVIESYVRKGSQLYIEGKLTHRSYEKDGQTRYITEIVASEMKLLGRKDGSSGGDSSAPAPAARQASAAAQSPQAGYQSGASRQAPSPAPANDIDLSPDETDDLPF